MSRTIHVFVSNSVVISGHFQTVEFSTPGHACTAKPITAPVYESVLPETHIHAIKIAEKIAKEKGMVLQVHNTSTRFGKLDAFLKGVKETPTVIIGNQKITGNITETALLSIL